MGLMEKIFGTYSDRELKKIEPLVNKVMSLEGEMEKLSDAELKEKTEEFKNRLNNGETTDDILPEAFAVVREAAWRVLGMKHFRVQVIGGIILHQGRIAEMKTGEGKTLVALRMISLVYLVAGHNLVASAVFQGLGNGVLSLNASIIRQILALLPVAYLMSKTGNLNAVWLAYPISEIADYIYCRHNLINFAYKKIDAIGEKEAI